MSVLQDEMIKHIRIVLQTPAKSYKEIAERLTVRLGYKVKATHVCNYLNILRRNPTYYEWTIPHVKHGQHKADGSDDKRFYRININRNGGAYTFDVDPEKLDNFRAGSISIISENLTKIRNQAMMLKVRHGQTQSQTQRAKINDLIMDGNYYVRKAEQFLEAIEAEAA